MKHDDTTVLEKLQQRETDLIQWLAENAPQCSDEQAHLDQNTPQRAYWHYGYVTAIRDVLNLLTGNRNTLKH